MGKRMVFAGAIGLAFAVLSAPCWAGGEKGVWYVNKNNPSSVQNGTSWDEAFTTIQPAIDAASAAGGGEVWVAAGTYDEPRTHIEESVNTGALQLKPGVVLRGGFNGTERKLNSRDWEKNATTISGEKARDGQRAFHVVFGADQACLDGFRITGGFADAGKRNSPLNAGGGVSCWDCSMTIENCVITGNGCAGTGVGGGIYCRNTDVRIKNCRIEGNTTEKTACGAGIGFVRCEGGSVVNTVIAHNRCADRGGGVYCWEASPSFSDCMFEKNEAAAGAGAAIEMISSPVFQKCTLLGNKAIAGGGLWIRAHSNPRLLDCTYTANEATRHGGGAFMWEASAPGFHLCTFSGNNAPEGGAIGALGASAALVKCTLDQNVSNTNGVVWMKNKSEVLVQECQFVSNQSYDIAVGDEESKTTVTATRFKDSGQGVLQAQYAGQAYVTVAELDAAFDGWTNNVQDDEALNVAAMEPGSAQSPVLEESSVEVTTENTKVAVKGNTAVLAITLVTLMVILVGAGVYFLARAHGTSAGPSRRALERAKMRLDSIHDHPGDD